MGEEMDIAVVNSTQESLGKWVKKPPLTEKLLRKPPFKFLHDIITTVIDTTGFLQDVYRADELKSDNIKDRDAKIEFLQKAVDRVALVTGKKPTMRPNKTVAGHEVEKTNQFLQTLAQAIQLHKEQAAGSKGTKEKLAKRSSTRDKKELTKSNSKEKLQKVTTNGTDSPKSSPSKQNGTDRSRPEKATKSSDRESSRTGEKTSKSRAIENGESKRGSVAGKSKDKSPEKASRTTSKTGTDGSKERRDKTGSSATNATKEQNESGSKGSSRDKKERSKDRKDGAREAKDRGSRETSNKDASKQRKESSKEQKEGVKESTDSGKDRNESSRERRAVSKDERNADNRHHRKQETSKEKRQTSGNAASEQVSSGRRRSDTFDAPVAEEDFIIAPKSSPKAVNLGGRGADEVNEVATERSTVSSARPGTARLSSAGQNSGAGRQQSAELQSKVPRGGDEPDMAAAGESPQAQPPPPQRSEQTRLDEDGGVSANKRPSTSTIRRASARPSTARPAAPKVRVVGSAQEEVPSNEPVAAVSNIILDQETKDDDEDDAFKVEESDNFLIAQEQSSRITSADNLQGKEHGSLVTQILDTKKDLEMGSLRPMTGFRGTSIDRQPVSDSTKRKERELFTREMEKLGEGVQTVTRCANPLGKLVDYLQEDIDTMLKELDMWTGETLKFESALQKEQSKVHVELESLQNRLQDADDAIETQVAKICAVKANILRNEDRIQKMMSLDKL